MRPRKKLLLVGQPISCPECGQEVEAAVTQCPHCSSELGASRHNYLSDEELADKAVGLSATSSLLLVLGVLALLVPLVGLFLGIWVFKTARENLAMIPPRAFHAFVMTRTRLQAAVVCACLGMVISPLGFFVLIFQNGCESAAPHVIDEPRVLPPGWGQ